jgi:RNA polymerase sigma factor (TIGR02999 family)
MIGTRLLAPSMRVDKPQPGMAHSAATIPANPLERPRYFVSQEDTLESTPYPLTSAAESAENLPTDALFSTLYSELHLLAKRQLARRWIPGSLSVTTLLHETYLDMAAGDGPSFPDRARFMGYAARVMRGLIIDHARRHSALKYGGEFEITSLQPELIGKPVDAKELLLINDVLEQMAKSEPDLAQLVDLKFFCGFSFAEIAAMQMLSERTVQRRWEKARIYIRHSMGSELPGESNA